MRAYITRYKVDSKEALGLFSYFFEYFKLRRKLEKEAGIENGRKWLEEHLDEFMEWLHRGQFEHGKDVRVLPWIIKHEETLKALRSGAKVSEILEVLAEIDPTIADTTFKRLDRTIRMLKDLTFEQLVDIAKHPAKLRYLEGQHRFLGELLERLRAIKESLKEEEE